MDLTADRAEIAAAANTAAGVKCSPSYSQISRPGHAMVRLGNATRDLSGFGFMVTWQVLIALPQEIAAADKWIDDHATALLDALAGAGVPEGFEPVELQLDSGRVPALQITVIRAA